MNISRQELTETYAGMSTEELLDHWESGTLTELATTVAGEELTRRGIALPAVTQAQDEEDLPVSEEEASFETVARSFTPTEMHILRGRLEADGIPAFVVDDNINQTNLLISVATGGVRLQVDSRHAQEAAKIIAEVNSGDRTLENYPPELPPDDKFSENAVSNWELGIYTAVFIFALGELSARTSFGTTCPSSPWHYRSSTLSPPCCWSSEANGRFYAFPCICR
jgi:hypothetical protein